MTSASVCSDTHRVRPLAARAALSALLFCGTLTLAGCPSSIAHMTLEAAPQPQPSHQVQVVSPNGFQTLYLLAGDLHFHMSPPDPPAEVQRTLAESLKQLKESGLDFVVVTPSLPPRFFQQADQRATTIKNLVELRKTLESIPEPKPLLIVGAEYNDPAFGEVGVLMADLPKLLKDLPPELLVKNPERFIQVTVDSGGVLVLLHPLAAPIDYPLPYAKRDLSWRPFFGVRQLPPEIAAIDRLFQGMEAYNIPVTQWRDKMLQEDEHKSLRAVMERMDDEILRRRRRIVAVGGSESRDSLTRATTFIATAERSAKGLREGLLAGRVCVRAPTPCSLRGYADDIATPVGVGGSLRARRQIELRWAGQAEVFRDGKSLGMRDGLMSAPVDHECHLFRISQDGGYSNPIYVNCPFADNPI